MKHEREPINAQIYEQASEWFMEYRSGDLDAGSRRRFVTWLRSSPLHVRAYLELAAIWNEGPNLDPRHELDGLDLTEAMTADNVVALIRPEPAPPAAAAAASTSQAAGSPASSSSASISQASISQASTSSMSGSSASTSGASTSLVSSSPPSSSHASTSSSATSPESAAHGPGSHELRARAARRRWHVPGYWRNLAASLATVTVLACAGYLYSQRNTYSTDIGEQRTFTLPDGSTIQLNALSEVRVDYDDAGRSVTLEQGQALFKVARDARRPFIVTADQTRVRAVGTQFDVNRRRSGTTVTVVEGRVAVGADLLSAGQQATVTAHETHKATRANVEAVTAWTQQRIVFESTPLEDVAVEFNRYNARQLVIRGNALAKLRITGSFSSTDPESILRFLRSRPGIVVTDDGHRIIVTSENSSAR